MRYCLVLVLGVWPLSVRWVYMITTSWSLKLIKSRELSFLPFNLFNLTYINAKKGALSDPYLEKSENKYF